MSEKRIDPEDGMAYTFQELSAYYKGKYNKAAVKAYWEELSLPKRTKNQAKTTAVGKAKEKAKAKAKVKVKANAKKEPSSAGPANPKRFINDDASVVQDCLDGLIWSTPNLGRLDTYPDVKVVFRTDWDKSKVAIISGGGAGHEPMHGGFVGKGMLTAAISGETFASPSIEAVLSAIVHVTGPKGCLLVIKNYTGDRLNFSMAAEQARSLFGLKVEVVVTKDDVATVAERGVAGTLFVHKVAGALSEEGKDLPEMKQAALQVIDSTASLGVSFSSVRRLKKEMIKLKKMEVGLGIHGEPGSRTQDMASSKTVVEIMMEGIMAGERMKADAPEGYACLINNLGSVPPQEMCIIANDLMKSKWASSIKLIIGPGQLCTSLDMNGASLSLLRLDSKLAKLLTSPTACTAWPAAVAPSFPTPVEGIKGLDPLEKYTGSTDSAVASALEKICKRLIASKKLLDGLDAKVGDADCGSTMASAATKVLEMKDKLPMADPQGFCQCMGAVLGKVMGGSSGVLMAIMWSGMATSIKKQIEAGSKNTWSDCGAKAFRDGLQAMMDAGGASPGARTMLDALVPAADELAAGKDFKAAKAAAEAGVEATKNMKPKAGRSENVPESVLKGVEDPGARAAALVFAELAES
jgi:dihydroxyacetone kinase